MGMREMPATASPEERTMTVTTSTIETFLDRLNRVAAERAEQVVAEPATRSFAYRAFSVLWPDAETLEIDRVVAGGAPSAQVSSVVDVTLRLRQAGLDLDQIAESPVVELRGMLRVMLRLLDA